MMLDRLLSLTQSLLPCRRLVLECLEHIGNRLSHLVVHSLERGNTKFRFFRHLCLEDGPRCLDGANKFTLQLVVLLLLCGHRTLHRLGKFRYGVGEIRAHILYHLFRAGV